jgi:Clp amino terminal domain, pathogenicity island component
MPNPIRGLAKRITGLWAESFAGAWSSAEAEAHALGAKRIGSDHLLLGILREGGGAVDRLVASEPRLAVDNLRRLVAEHAADDLGIPAMTYPRGHERTQRSQKRMLRLLAPNVAASTTLEATPECVRALEAGAEEGVRYGVEQVLTGSVYTSENLLLALLRPGYRAGAILQKAGLNPTELHDRLLHDLASRSPPKT